MEWELKRGLKWLPRHKKAHFISLLATSTCMQIRIFVHTICCLFTTAITAVNEMKALLVVLFLSMMVVISIQQELPGVDPLTNEDTLCFANEMNNRAEFEGTCEGVDFDAVGNSSVSIKLYTMIMIAILNLCYIVLVFSILLCVTMIAALILLSLYFDSVSEVILQMLSEMVIKHYFNQLS